MLSTIIGALNLIRILPIIIGVGGLGFGIYKHFEHNNADVQKGMAQQRAVDLEAQLAASNKRFQALAEVHEKIRNQEKQIRATHQTVSDELAQREAELDAYKSHAETAPCVCTPDSPVVWPSESSQDAAQ